MLVSTRHKFVFLSNRKCASSSLIQSLGPFADIIMGKDHRLRHSNFAEYQKFILPFLVERVGEEARDYAVYCLFREPVDWLFSWYRFRTREDISPKVSPDHWEYTGNISWADFLNESLKDKPAMFASFPAQHTFVKGLDGTTKGLTLFRYDQIDRFLDAVRTRVGEDFEVVNWNVSPRLSEGPTKADYKRCRKELAADYQVYDAIDVGEDRPGFFGKLASRAKRTR